MKLKRYEAATEQAAMEKIRDELGPDAIVLSIKKTQPKGIFAFFRKPKVEVTAAYDDKPKPEVPVRESASQSELTDEQATELLSKNKRIIEQEEMIRALEKRLKSNEDLLSKTIAQLNSSRSMAEFSNRRYEDNVIQLFFDTLVEQGVQPEVAMTVLEDANSIEDSDKIDISIVTKVVYNTIIRILGEPAPLNVPGEPEADCNEVFFLGPTGVGKTTTIAKLSSGFILDNNIKVGLVTADTYRIAAVEQLKVYGEILGIDVCVAYKADDLSESLDKLRKTEDIILIDTAGRSHKNGENLDELSRILNAAPDSRKFLVLSVTTKYEDMLDIIDIYSRITDFDLIFTKLDETTSLGCVLNICCKTGRRLSYVAYGQNVPDDIEVVQPDKIAKSLLGFGGGVY